MNQIIITPFEDENLNDVVKLIATSFSSKFENILSLSFSQTVALLKETWSLSESNPDNGHFVAKINDKIVGVILLKYSTQKREFNQPLSVADLIKKYRFTNVMKYMLAMSLLDHKLLEKECYIEHIATSSDYRGMGIGTMLIDYARNFAKTLPGVSKMSLNVAASNTRAYQLYNRLGFVEPEKSAVDSRLMGWLVKERKWHYMVSTL